MLSLPPATRIYMAVQPLDLRKGFDGLSALVQTVFDRSVLDGHLFLLLNRRRDRIKILWWDQDGLAIFDKRLERGTSEVPAHAPEARGVGCRRSNDGVGTAGDKRARAWSSSTAIAHHTGKKRRFFLLGRYLSGGPGLYL